MLTIQCFENYSYVLGRGSTPFILLQSTMYVCTCKDTTQAKVRQYDKEIARTISRRRQYYLQHTNELPYLMLWKTETHCI